jgi:hypothetical protein
MTINYLKTSGAPCCRAETGSGTLFAVPVQTNAQNHLDTSGGVLASSPVSPITHRRSLLSRGNLLQSLKEYYALGKQNYIPVHGRAGAASLPQIIKFYTKISQRIGSVLRIRDILSRIPNPRIFHPGSRILRPM